MQSSYIDHEHEILTLSVCGYERITFVLTRCSPDDLVWYETGARFLLPVRSPEHLGFCPYFELVQSNQAAYVMWDYLSVVECLIVIIAQTTEPLLPEEKYERLMAWHPGFNIQQTSDLIAELAKKDGSHIAKNIYFTYRTLALDMI